MDFASCELAEAVQHPPLSQAFADLGVHVGRRSVIA